MACALRIGLSSRQPCRTPTIQTGRLDFPHLPEVPSLAIGASTTIPSSPRLSPPVSGGTALWCRPSFSHDIVESADTTWRALAEVETSQGTVYIKIPMFNAKIQTLVTNCQRQNELERRRNGRQDAPARADGTDAARSSLMKSVCG